MDFKNFFQSKKFKIILAAIGGIILILSAFGTGVFVGLKKANFSYRWGENYHRNFGGPRGGFFEDPMGKDLIDAYGTFGQIIKIDGSTLVVKGQNDAEKIILVKNNTTIKKGLDTIKITDLKVDDRVVIIGDSNNSGQIEAKLIRTLPENPPRMPR